MEEKYFKLLITLAKKAAKINEVPVSALIVRNNKIIAKAYNKRNKSKSILDHAEVLVIKKASRKLHDWRLNDCNLYVTLKPCNMCQTIINQSRLKNVFYLIDKSENKKEYYKTNYEKVNEHKYEQEYKTILSIFFSKKRDK